MQCIVALIYFTGEEKEDQKYKVHVHDHAGGGGGEVRDQTQGTLPPKVHPLLPLLPKLRLILRIPGATYGFRWGEPWLAFQC